MVLVHIVAGLLAIACGFVALFAAKGSYLHRRAGIVFVSAMLVMATMGGLMAAMQFHIGLQKMNVIAATITIYLVVTALLTVRPRGPASHALDMAGLAMAIGAALFAIWIGLDAIGKSRSIWFPTVPALVFGSIALLAAYGDLRLVTGHAPEGPRRLARHLWRMCFAMFIATGSFFLGQATKVFPEALRIFPLLAAPVILVLLAMLYWLVRVRIFKRVPRAVAVPAT